MKAILSTHSCHKNDDVVSVSSLKNSYTGLRK